MKVTRKEHVRGSTLKLIFSVACKHDDKETVTAPINVHNLAQVRLKFILDCNLSLEPHISFKKHEMANNSAVKIIVSYANFEKQCLCTDDWTEFIYMKPDARPDMELKTKFNIYTFVVEVTLTVHDMTCKLLHNRLYDDTKFTDFNLRAADGMVAVHKAVLGVHSEVFLTMLNGEWKETADGQISIDGVTVQTLQHLKDYMYLSILPDDRLQLQQLLLVAGCYLVDNLKTKCILKLVESITPENFDAVIDFAFQNNLPELVKAMVIHIPDHIVNGIHNMTINEDSKKNLKT